MSDYDVVVVGAGIGGSGVAALLAQRGRKVLLIERNPKVGGKCTSFERDGFKVPTYVHAFARGSRGNCAHIAGLLGERLLWEDVHAVDVNIGGELMNLPIKARITNPLGSGIKIPFREMLSMAGIALDSLFLSRKRQEELDDIDIRSWLLRRTENRQMHAIMGFLAAGTFVVPYWEASAGEFIRILSEIRKAKAIGYPVGDCSSIPESYVRGFRKFGGELRQDSVRRVLVEDGRARGVELDGGEIIESDAVVSNAGIRRTAVDLVGEEHLGKEYMEYIRKLKPTWGVVVVKVAVSKRVSELPGFFYGPSLDPVGYFEKVERGELPDELALWVTSPVTGIPSLCPPGTQLISAGTPVPFREGADWSAWAARSFDSLERILPDIPRYELWRDVVTPAHVQKWEDIEGVMMEAAQVTGQVGRNRPSIASPLKGLYFVGADVGTRGVGVDIAAESAIRCAELVDSGFEAGPRSITS